MFVMLKHLVLASLPLALGLAAGWGFAYMQGSCGSLVGPVFALEIATSLALLLGVYARQAALLSVPILLTVVWVHAPNGWVHVAQGGGWEYPAFLLAALASQVLLGGGAHALRVPMRPPAVACGEAHAPRPSWRSRAALSNYLD